MGTVVGAFLNANQNSELEMDIASIKETSYIIPITDSKDNSQCA